MNVGEGGEPEAKTGMAAAEREAEVISDRNESEATKPVVIAEPADPKVKAAGVPPSRLPRARMAFGKSLASMGAVRPAWVRSFGENVGQGIRKESCHPRGVQQTRVMIDAIKAVFPMSKPFLLFSPCAWLTLQALFTIRNVLCWCCAYA